jgi:hypothetical protein
LAQLKGELGRGVFFALHNAQQKSGIAPDFRSGEPHGVAGVLCLLIGEPIAEIKAVVEVFVKVRHAGRRSESRGIGLYAPPKQPKNVDPGSTWVHSRFAFQLKNLREKTIFKQF